jgi:transposase
MDARKERGVQLAQRGHIVKQGDGWQVLSQTGNGHYLVKLDKTPSCTCPDFEVRRNKCKHIYAVECLIVWETVTDGRQTTVTQTKTIRVTYKQQWPAYNAAQTEEKTRFVVLLHALCRLVDQPLQHQGRPRLLFSDILFSCIYKVYCCFSFRRFMSDLRDAETKQYIHKAPHFNSVSNYLADPTLTQTFAQLVTLSSLPLKGIENNFAVDSSGFSTCRFVRWFNKKYGWEIDNREWVKVHLMCGVDTKIITSVDVSGWAANDSPYFVPLLERTAKYFQMQEVSADKEYLSHKNLEATAKANALPFIPFKVNTAIPTKNSIWSEMYHHFMYNREEFLSHYHQRSNVETAFSMIKAKFGDAVRSKSDIGQLNEVLCKVLCHNLCVLIQAIHELGIEPKFAKETYKNNLFQESQPPVYTPVVTRK